LLERRFISSYRVTVSAEVALRTLAIEREWNRKQRLDHLPQIQFTVNVCALMAVPPLVVMLILPV
jgi:hypothetical protein